MKPKKNKRRRSQKKKAKKCEWPAEKPSDWQKKKVLILWSCAVRLVNITPQSKGEEEEEEEVLSRYSSGVHKVLDDGCSLTSAITPRLYFNYTETAAMKSKNNMQRR